MIINKNMYVGTWNFEKCIAKLKILYRINNTNITCWDLSLYLFLNKKNLIFA